jgi:hypothetical protein
LRLKPLPEVWRDGDAGRSRLGHACSGVVAKG